MYAGTSMHSIEELVFLLSLSLSSGVRLLRRSTWQHSESGVDLGCEGLYYRSR